ncbi:MAG: rhomboid family intramembrane serine protease [Muribaculaceae bacterium]|nr:rhomboid family intramembrane serine protease [Muribaculaceae bacterium]MDE5845683.1 rhomboid family intramembrane serine protease [Muribaculaceae bacterium]
MARFSTDFRNISVKQTIILIATVNLAVFVFLNIATRLFPDSQPIGSFFLETENTYHLWSLATYSFCHISFSHLIVNMAVLILAGFIIEKKSITRLSGKNVAIIYMASAFGGGIAFLVSAHHSSVLIGASAAVMGLSGALALACINTSITLPFPGRINVMTLILILLAWVIVVTAASSPETTIVHSAGLATGILSFTLLTVLQRYKSLHNRLSKRSYFDRLNLKVRTSGFTSLNDDERNFFINQSQDNAKQQEL